MHKIITLICRDKAGVWIDARKSSGGAPFEELTPIEGFPQELTFEQEVVIPIIDFTQIIYVRDCRTVPGKSSVLIGNFYCIQCADDVDIRKAYVYPLF